MNERLKIWGRDFNLKVVYDQYEGEEVLPIQTEALKLFINTSNKELATCDKLKDYCISQDGDRIGGTIENIFKYVMPESLFIKRDTKDHCVVLLCRYKFDEEHGIALFFRNEKLEKIATQDDI